MTGDKTLLPDMVGWTGVLFTPFLWLICGSISGVGLVFVAPIFGLRIPQASLLLWTAITGAVLTVGLVAADAAQRRTQLERRITALERALEAALNSRSE